MKALSGNPEARKMLKASREPANPEEAAALYAEIAEKNGISVTKETIRQLLEAKEKAQQTATAQAESAVKQALDEDSLEGIAGGANGGCESTASKGEWCWFSDSCTYVINYYNDNGIEWVSKECEKNAFGDQMDQTVIYTNDLDLLSGDDWENWTKN